MAPPLTPDGGRHTIRRMGVQSPAIGAMLGHYRLLEQVGRGGMGVVFRAYDEQLARDVAVNLSYHSGSRVGFSRMASAVN
jgi:serine/threonine protein kinase